MSRKFGGADRRNRWSNEPESCSRGGGRFDVGQKSGEQWGEETVVVRVPRSRIAEVMALLKSAPTELI